MPPPKFAPKPSESEDAELIGTITAGVIGAVGVIVIISDIPNFIEAIHTIKSNIMSRIDRT